MGCPEVLITDQGREFVDSLSSQLYSITHTEHRITSAYHPQTNGLTERFNQTLTRCLAKVVDEYQSDWDERIDTVLMGYRASRQASTKQSPYFILFQQDMQLPIDSEVLPQAQNLDQEDPDAITTRIAQLLQSREEAFKDAEANIALAQKKQKETYDRKHQPPVLKLDSKVLLENTAQKQRKGGKMEPLWLGPYIINKDLGEVLGQKDSMKIISCIT